MTATPIGIECSAESHVDPSVFDPLITSTHAGCLLRLCGNGRPLPSGEFFDAVMQLMIDVLDPALMFVGALDADDSAHTVVAYRGAKRTENFTYRLTDTPCSEVLVPRGACIYTEDVAELFPRSAQLRALEAQGYVGMHLRSRSDEQIGLIAAATAHRIGNIAEVRAAYYGFRCRLALELERILLHAAGADTTDIERAITGEERALCHALSSASYRPPGGPAPRRPAPSRR